jgi:hypothetical protein
MNRVQKWIVGIGLVIALSIPALGCGYAGPLAPIVQQDPTTSQPSK